MSSGALRDKRNNKDYYKTYKCRQYVFTNFWFLLLYFINWIYRSLISDREEDSSKSGDNNYGARNLLLDSYKDMPDPYREQIDLDLKRTFADDDFINNQEHVNKTMNILLAYAKRNTAVGYCQGMNYLAGMIIRVVEDEEDAFWVLTNLFETILPLDYFWLMTEILIDQKIIIQILQKKKIKLFKHLQHIGLDFAIISFQWLIWLLSANLTKSVAESIWDFLFLEGSVTIFRGIIAILNILEEEILKQEDFNDLYQILDNGPKQTISNPEVIIKQMSKFRYIKHSYIEKCRNRMRPLIMEEQK